jgi:hypothetical protein
VSRMLESILSHLQVVLGAAAGVTSLIIQITDECIKGLPDPNLRGSCSSLVGFKFYSEATNMPETYRYLRVRSQIEQQRFLNFALEAGIFVRGWRDLRQPPGQSLSAVSSTCRDQDAARELRCSEPQA